MLARRRYITVILLLLLTAFCTTALIVNTHKPYIQHKNKQENPDSFMTHIRAIQINKYGKQRGILVSPKLTGYRLGETTVIEKPFFVLNMPHSPPWHLRANHAKAINGMDEILLWDKVRVQQLPGKNSRNITFLTSKITVYPEKSLATTHEPVTVKRPGSIMHAVGLTADLKTGDIKLLSKIQGQYSATEDNK